jgi:hypothetical protein
MSDKTAESKILIDNIPSRLNTAILLAEISKEKKIHTILGTATDDYWTVEYENIVSEIIMAILVHDKICVDIDNFEQFDYIFGITDLCKLIEQNIIEIINTNGNIISLMRPYESKYFKLSSFFKVDYLNYIEDSLVSKYSKNNVEVKQLLYYIESKQIKLDMKEINNEIDKENLYDLNNQNLGNALSMKMGEPQEIHKVDAIKVLRNANMNRALIYGAHINASNILLDSYAKEFLNLKFSPLLSQYISTSSVDSFNKVLDLNEIPDLGKLYLNGIISVDDIINIRNNVEGKMFRLWYNSIDYNPEVAVKTLIKSKSKSVSARITDSIRWIIPNAIGIFNPVLGVASSAVDSFVVSKILKGWNPSLFLDDKLKNNIDKRIRQYEQEQNYERIRRLFPHITYNDRCPCGKGKPFGKCCGKGFIGK